MLMPDLLHYAALCCHALLPAHDVTSRHNIRAVRVTALQVTPCYALLLRAVTPYAIERAMLRRDSRMRRCHCVVCVDIAAQLIAIAAPRALLRYAAATCRRAAAYVRHA